MLQSGVSRSIQITVAKSKRIYFSENEEHLADIQVLSGIRGNNPKMGGRKRKAGTAVDKRRSPKKQKSSRQSSTTENESSSLVYPDSDPAKRSENEMGPRKRKTRNEPSPMPSSRDQNHTRRRKRGRVSGVLAPTAGEGRRKVPRGRALEAQLEVKTTESFADSSGFHASRVEEKSEETVTLPQRGISENIRNPKSNRLIMNCHTHIETSEVVSGQQPSVLMQNGAPFETQKSSVKEPEKRVPTGALSKFSASASKTPIEQRNAKNRALLFVHLAAVFLLLFSIGYSLRKRNGQSEAHCSNLQDFENFCGEKVLQLERQARVYSKSRLLDIQRNVAEIEQQLEILEREIKSKNVKTWEPKLNDMTNLLDHVETSLGYKVEKRSPGKGSSSSKLRLEKAIHVIDELVRAAEEYSALKSTTTAQIDYSLGTLLEEINSIRHTSMQAGRETRTQTEGVAFEKATAAFLNEALEDAIETFQADGIGRHDIAVISGGSEVLADRQYTSMVDYVHKDLPKVSKESVLTPTLPVRGCYSFVGSSGSISIAFPYRSNIRAVAVEHGTSDLLAFHSASVAPQQVSLFGLRFQGERLTGKSNETHLGDFDYRMSKKYSRIQTYSIPVSLNDLEFDAIRIHVSSNHGHKDYTCLHRIRVLA